MFKDKNLEYYIRNGETVAEKKNKKDYNKKVLTRNQKNLVNEEFLDTFLKLHPGNREFRAERTIREFNDFLVNKVLNTREGVELPYHLGILITIVYPNKNNPLNIIKSIDHNKEIQYTNMESDGYGTRILYITSQASRTFKYVKFWGFKPTPEVNKQLGETFKRQWKLYAVVSNIMFSSALFTKKKRVVQAKTFEERANKDYNPLEW
jgi:hypothetical protein